MSPVEFKKTLCRPVESKGQGPQQCLYRYQQKQWRYTSLVPRPTGATRCMGGRVAPVTCRTAATGCCADRGHWTKSHPPDPSGNTKGRGHDP